MAQLDYLDTRRRSMEDAFFMERDLKLIERLKEMKKMEETRQNLSKVSGITNEAVLQKLVDLKIKPETVASIALVPLVEVAWADGEVDEKERAAVLKATRSTVFAGSGVDSSLIEQWLTQRPPPELLTTWIDYVQELCKLLTPEERKALSKDVMEHAAAVAGAAGSFLGLTSGISSEERSMLDKLRKAFDSSSKVK
ncbi:MAG: hypothetical protein C0404_13840 [Verrucomicrobia bacterium]|nr:hypothetical protein [Verrucomicrobiota bacterium]